MQKTDEAIKKETLYIVANVITLSLVVQIVFIIIGKWDYTVLLGNILGGLTAVLNFYVMGLTVQKALASEKQKAVSMMKLSQIGRLLVMFGVAVAGIKLAFFSAWTVIIPFFFPRIALLYRPLFEKKLFPEGTKVAPSEPASEEEKDNEK